MNVPCVIVPVYNAPGETEDCLRSVIRETRGPYRLLVLDDASTDERIGPLLNSLKGEHPTMEVYRHEKNKGFAANVNDGMMRAEGDVVLLNSDTIVSAHWLEKLTSCAYYYPHVATVTPLSNGAGAFSTPKNNHKNEIPVGMSISDVAKKMARVSYPIPVEAPSGNGFCLYIRRYALEKVGLFDAEAFPLVGEENDFCQRAQALGLVNLIESSCYIYHVSGASFGGPEAKASIMDESKETIHKRYPNYRREVWAFLDSPQLQKSRQCLEYALKKKEAEGDGPPRKRVLSIVHRAGGGLVQSSRDIMGSLEGHFDTYELSCAPQKWILSSVEKDEEINTWEFGTPWLSTGPPDVFRLMAMRSLIRAMNIEVVHIQTLICLGPEILRVFKNEGVSIVLSFHDFNAICPTNHLIDNKETFCGGHCTEGEGDCAVSLRWFSDIKKLKHSYVHRWRERMASTLPLADAFSSPSESTKNLILEHFPNISQRKFRVIEFGQRWERTFSLASPPAKRLKVVVLGVPSVYKGISLLSRLIDLNNSSGKAFEFHLLGGFPFYKKRGACVICHGPYKRDGLPVLIENIRPSYSLLCSIAPENYSHTLTESWMLGLPVLASDMGAFRERIGQHGGGCLVDPRRPDLWMEMLNTLHCEETWKKLRDQVRDITLPSESDMANEYASLYRFSMEQRA